MSSKLQATLAHLKAQIAKDIHGLSDFNAGVRQAALATRNLNDSTMATMLALGALPMHQEMIRHRQEAEIEFSRVMATIRVSHERVPIPMLVQLARGLIVTMVERCASPPAGNRPESIAYRLGTAGTMMSLLEKVDDTTHLLQLDARSPQDTTIAALERNWRETYGVRGYRESPLMSRLFKRFCEDVYALHGMVLHEASIEKTWDLNTRHDYHASFADLAQAAMDAALILECNFEDRVFGPQGTADAA